jgi:hypothetical protein
MSTTGRTALIVALIVAAAIAAAYGVTLLIIQSIGPVM